MQLKGFKKLREFKKRLLKSPKILKFAKPVWLKLDQYKKRKKILFEGAQGIS